MAERRKLEEAISLKQNHINIQNNLNNEKDRELARLEGIVTDLNDKLAVLKSEEANMKSFKVTIVLPRKRSGSFCDNR